MWWQQLGLARDVSVVLLALEFLILGIIPFLILRVITRALRRFLPKVRPALRKVASVVTRVQEIVTRIMNGVTAPIIAASRSWRVCREAWRQ